MTIILFFIFIFISIILAFKKPTKFILFYLLVSTKFLGFFDTEYYFIIGGIGLGAPIINIIALTSSFFAVKWYKIPKKDFYFIIFLLLFLLYGVSFPTYLGYETTAQAIIASKEFWTIFLFIYMVAHRNNINLNPLIKSIQYIGLYLAIVYILFLVTSIAPPFYLEEDRMRGFFPTYISLSLFLFYVQFKNKFIHVFHFLLVASILLVGLALALHFSLLISTVILLIILYIFYNNNNFDFKYSILKIFFIMFIFISILMSFSNLRNKILISSEQIIKGTDVALTSREIYNRFRWDAIAKEPLTGYGFIHKSAPLMKSFKTIENNRFAESFGVIDSGYVDLLIKFGYIGTFFYLFLWSKVSIFILLRPSHHNFFQIGMAAYLTQYYLITYTWSVFTFSHGLIPGLMAVYFIFHTSKHQH